MQLRDAIALQPSVSRLHMKEHGSVILFTLQINLSYGYSKLKPKLDLCVSQKQLPCYSIPETPHSDRKGKEEESDYLVHYLDGGLKLFPQCIWKSFSYGE